jgi:hypothetical protein
MRFCLALLCAAALSAQIQPPEEIGPLPGGIKPPRNEPPPQAEVTGLLRRLDTKSLIVEPDDKRIITVGFDNKSKLDRASLAPGDTIFLSAAVKDGRWTAIEVRLVEKATSTTRRRAAEALPTNAFEDGETAPAATPAPAAASAPNTTVRMPDGEERPRLTRGKPANTNTNTNTTSPPLTVKLPEPEMIAVATTPKTAPPAPAPSTRPGDPFLARAREAAANYTATLPNFIAKQITTRYERPPRGDFGVKDQIECEVLVEKGLERYRGFRRGGRSIKNPAEEGAWSAGEFRTLQIMVLENSAAVFFNKTKETIGRRQSVRYQFTVPKDASQWRVQAEAQIYLPAYSGTIWLDAESARVLRLEMESRGIPEGFPVAKAESTVDYEFVRLGDRQYLLPAAAALLSCEAVTRVCAKNEIQFRHYRTFGAESTITFEDPK